ncbi:hypothetical protein NJNGDCLN_01842 [Mannheimia haemolytica]
MSKIGLSNRAVKPRPLGRGYKYKRQSRFKFLTNQVFVVARYIGE